MKSQRKPNIAAKLVLGTVVSLLVAGGTVQAEPFVNPPELNHPDWETPFPYQRNILIGFDTNPHFWPDHITSPTPDARKALTPGVVHHEGIDDGQLYSSDWLAGEVNPPGSGKTRWLDADTITGTNRQGILVLEGEANSTFTLVWHIDNWDRPWQEKRFFVEAEYYSTGNIGGDELISSTGQIETLTSNYEDLADGWVRWHSWATLIPNPLWEEMVNTITFEVPGRLLLDHMHIATECLPEPTSLALFGLAAIALSVISLRRRR